MTDLIKRDDALLPCPFCGGEASKIPDANHSTGWEVGCFSGKCDIEPHVWAVHLSTAVMQWNTRADRLEKVVKENYQLTMSLKMCHECWDQALDERNDAEDKLTECEARLGKAVEMLRETTQMLSQCTFTIIRMKGQYFERHEVVDKANAVLAELEVK